MFTVAFHQVCKCLACIVGSFLCAGFASNHWVYPVYWVTQTMGLRGVIYTISARLYIPLNVSTNMKDSAKCCRERITRSSWDGLTGGSRSTAEVFQHLHKGAKILVCGTRKLEMSNG